MRLGNSTDHWKRTPSFAQRTNTHVSSSGVLISGATRTAISISSSRREEQEHIQCLANDGETQRNAPGKYKRHETPETKRSIARESCFDATHVASTSRRATSEAGEKKGTGDTTMTTVQMEKRRSFDRSLLYSPHPISSQTAVRMAAEIAAPKQPNCSINSTHTQLQKGSHNDNTSPSQPSPSYSCTCHSCTCVLISSRRFFQQNLQPLTA